MPLGSNLSPEQILHERKCSEKIRELYIQKNGVVGLFWIMGASAGVHLGTRRALKGRRYIVRACSSLLANTLTLISSLTFWFDVSLFFLIIITKLI